MLIYSLMSLYKLPILILCYNKLNSLKRIISILKKLKYSNIYISLDGPSSDNDQNNLKVLEYVNQLKTKKKYNIKINKYNKGCKTAVSQAITWFFKNEEKGVILEEDCIPSNSFFKFCYFLLEKYENNKKIGHISGTNPLKFYNSKHSYFFSHYGGVWGWATWRDRWSKYDVKMKEWKNYEKFNLYFKTKNFLDFILRLYQLNKTYKNKIDTWDYQWTFSKIKNNYLSIIPSKNLITNVGFNKKAKHTFDNNNSFSFLKKFEIRFPLIHNNRFEHCNIFYNRVVNQRIGNILRNKIWVKF
jgi:hypothetical protein